MIMQATATIDTPDRPADPAELRSQVEDFIFYEAELADAHRCDDWYALWTEDALYWVPANEDDFDPNRHVSIIYEDLEKIETRLFRLKGKRAHAQQPRSRLARVVSNIRIKPAEKRDEIVATANFVLGDVRLNRQEIWMGRVRYLLRRVDGKLKMVQKKVMLLGNDMPVGNLTFIV
jgi:3-phenylpropionate/cinnamic acid dioxygenase small subunit